MGAGPSQVGLGALGKRLQKDPSPVGLWQGDSPYEPEKK